MVVFLEDFSFKKEEFSFNGGVAGVFGGSLFSAIVGLNSSFLGTVVPYDEEKSSHMKRISLLILKNSSQESRPNHCFVAVFK